MLLHSLEVRRTHVAGSSQLLICGGDLCFSRPENALASANSFLHCHAKPWSDRINRASLMI